MVSVGEDATVEGPGFLVKLCPRIFRAVDSEWKVRCQCWRAVRGPFESR
jgi:hypothetical protein